MSLFRRKRLAMPPIETPRFILQPANPLLLAFATYHWTKDVAGFAYLGWRSEGWTRWRWHRHLRSLNRRNRYIHAIFSKRDRRCIGIHLVSMSGFQTIADLGILVGETAWRGQEVMVEVRRAMIRDLFLRLGVDRIVNIISAENRVSIKNTIEVGSTLEGTLRSGFVFSNGKTSDKLIFGLLRSEWLERHKDEFDDSK